MNAGFETLFEWAWRTSLQASVLMALVFVTQAAFRRWLRPKWQYALSLLVLIRLVLPAVPESSFSVFNWAVDLPTKSQDGQHLLSPHPSPLPWGEGETPAAVGQAENSDRTEARATMFLAHEGEGQGEWEHSVRWPSGAVYLEEHAARRNAISPPIPPPDVTAGLSLVPAMKWAWAIGFGLIALTAFWSHRRFTGWVKAQAPVDDTRIVSLLDDAKAVMGVTGQIEVRRVERLDTPALFGFRKPCLLVPAEVLERLEDSELHMVFLHELAHLKRRDILLNWVIILVRALHWFNPLVWLSMRRLRADRELVCDEMVLAHLNADDRRLYGNTLVKLLEHFSKIRFCPSLVPVINRKTEIKRRITMIAQFKSTNCFAIVTSVGLIALLCLLTFTRAAAEKTAEPTTKSGSEKQNRQPQDEYFKNPRKGAPEASMPAAASIQVGRQHRSIQVLEDQLKQHEEQLNQAQQRMDQLRRDLKVADIVPSDGAVRNVEPETIRMIERERVTAKSLQAQYETLHRSLRGLSKDALRSALPTASPDAILTELLIKLSLAESEQASLGQEFAMDHPKLKSLSSLIKNLNTQIDARVEGILVGLETQAKAQVARVAHMEDEEVKARNRDAELTAKYRPYFQAKRDFETQQRIYETIKLRLLQETVDAALPPGPGRNTKLPIPLTRDTIAFQPHSPGIAGTYDRIVVLGSNVGEVRGEAQSDKIIANLDDGAERARFAVARISMIGAHPELIERINLKRERLLDGASSLFASKTLNDIEKPGFRNLLKAEVLTRFNEILGQGTLHEIVITEFVVQ